MCLTLPTNWKSLNKKKQQETYYKIYRYVNNYEDAGLRVCSPYRGAFTYLTKYSTVKSSRRYRALESSEIKTRAVLEGIHVYNDLARARREAKTESWQSGPVIIVAVRGYGLVATNPYTDSESVFMSILTKDIVAYYVNERSYPVTAGIKKAFNK